MFHKYFQRNQMMLEAQMSGGKILALEILIFIAVLFVSQIPQSIIVEAFMVLDLLRNPEFISLIKAGDMTGVMSSVETMMSVISLPTMLTQLFSTGITTVIVILYCRVIEKRRTTTMGFRKKNAPLEYVAGIAIGFVMFAAAIGICALTGAVTFTGATADFSVGMLLLFFLGYLIQGMSEEVLCRGYFFVSAQRKNAVLAAMLANSLIFSFLHLMNPGVTILALINIFLFGIFMSLYVLRRGNLWGACAIHSMWNFAQGNIFGVHVSGTEIFCSPISTIPNQAKTLFNGGDFGLEGGLAVTIILILGITALFFMKNNPNEYPDMN